MSGLKSSYEIALEKVKGMGIGDGIPLSEEQKQQVAEIRREFDAKAAEKKILLKGSDELPDEIRKLEIRRDEKIDAVYQEARKQSE